MKSVSWRSFSQETSKEATRSVVVSVAIVGSGPSGCYTAKYLQSLTAKKNIAVRIDVIDRLPTPYGLVRYGVAPDHPEVKNVQNDFDALFEGEEKTEGGRNNKNRFLGNVHVGVDVSVAELRALYDVVVLSYGCQSDRKLGIPGENLDGVLSAREFVAWYNGRFLAAHTTLQGSLMFWCFGDRDKHCIIH